MSRFLRTRTSQGKIAISNAHFCMNSNNCDNVESSMKGMRMTSGMRVLRLRVLVAVTMVLFGLVALDSGAEAAVSVLDSTWSSVNGSTAPTALTYSAPSGDDRIVLVLIGNEQANGDINVTADPTPNVTIGGQSAYFVGNVAGGNSEVWVFYRLYGSSVSATSANITVNWATNPTTGTMIAAATYGGVKQTYGIGASGAINAVGTGGVASNGDIVVAGVSAVQDGVGVLWINENNATANIGVTASLPWVFTENHFFPSTSNANELQTSQVAGAGGLSGNITHTVTGGRGSMVAFALNPAPTGPAVNWTAASQSSAVESGTMTVTAQLSATHTLDVTVPFTVSGTATGGGTDYSITASPITITAGSTTGSATITIAPDTLDENNETVILTMGTPTNGNIGTTTVHTATITDDDAPPTVQFSSASGSGDEATTPATATATLSAASGLTVTVAYATANGTAVQPGDYTSTSGTLTFNPGETSKPINVPIIDDAAAELSEDFTVTLSGPTNATLGSPTTFTYTIFDNENTPPTISAIADRTIDQDTATSAIPFTVGDAETPATSLTLSGASSNATLVPVSNIVFGGSGANRTVTVTPAAGQNGLATITVTVTDGLGATADSAFVLTVNAISASTTTNGPTATAGFSRIKVTAPYTGDNDAVPDNTLQVLVFDDAGYTSLIQDSGVIAHSASPYNYTAGGLVNGTTYYVRVIYSDPDGVSGTGGTAINANNYRIDLGALTPLDTLTHNSVNTSSSYWGGNWGTATGKYGEFTCTTCHVAGTSNIKRVRATITTPDGTDWRNDAAEGPDVAVTYLDANETGGTDMGDDDPNGDGGATKRTTSVAVCEVCHSQVQYHRYNNSAQTVFSHNNKTDCVKCHAHSKGFKASCDACHGNPPITADNDGSTSTGLAHFPGPTGSSVPGAHDTHVNTASIACEICHAGSAGNGSTHNSGNVTITFANLPTGTGGVNGGSYSGQTGVSYDETDAGTTQVPPAISNDGTMTCAVYCHGTTIGGSNPTWDGAVVCGDCHGATAASPPANPASGTSHATHAGTGGTSHYQGGDVALACNNCHGASPGGQGHVDGVVVYNVTALATDPQAAGSASYSGATSGDSGGIAPSSPYLTCTNVACHWGTETPDWNSGPADCTTCHGGATTGGTGAPDTGQHAEHVLASGDYITCDKCHGTNSQNGTHAGHIDGSLTLGGDLNATIYADGGTTRQAGDANYADNDSCARACHQQADWGPSGAYNTASWNSGTPTIDWSGGTCDPATYDVVDLCIDCHSDAYSYTGRSGPTVVTGWDFAGASTPTGAHLKVSVSDTLEGDAACLDLEAWKARCNSCHTKHGGPVTIPLPPSSWDNPGTAATETTDMRVQLGINYTGTDHNGIKLGGTATNNAGWYLGAGQTEAEMCWGCHGTDTTINEWGYNADTNGTNVPYTSIDPDITNPAGHTYWQGPSASRRESYNYGYIYSADHDAAGAYTAGNATSRWVDANGAGYYRRDAYQHSNQSSPGFVLSQRIVSVHSVNFNAGSQVSSVATNIDGSGNVTRTTGYSNQETAANIRCTYCHDVHDLNLGANDTSSGRPYLRGTWMGNPYGPDMPPITGYTYPTTGGPVNFGQRFVDPGTTSRYTHQTTSGAPRLYSDRDIQAKGGYFIDQNSNWPTYSTNTQTGTVASLSSVAGLCTTCHGTDIDNMDFYDNASTSMWRADQVNGHANSTIGGSGVAGSNDRNLFSADRGANFFMAAQYGVGVNRWDPRGLNPPYSSRMNRAQDGAPRAVKNSGWYGGTLGSETKDGDYTAWHDPSITATTTTAIGSNSGNGGRAHDFTCSKCHSPHATGLPALLITNCLDESVATWSLAASPTGNGPIGPGGSNTGIAWEAQNNCHRKESTTTGWHRLNTAQ